jgi:hypothetical protein
MCAMAAAAGRKISAIIRRIQNDRERPQARQKYQQDGKGTPHLGIMLHELWSGKPFGEVEGHQVSSMHLDFLTLKRRI